MAKKNSEDKDKKRRRADGAASNAERQEGEPAAVVANSVPTETKTTGKTEEVFFTTDAYKSHIELYKFGLEYAFKAVTIFFLLASGVLTFGLSSDKASTPPDVIVRSVLLITSFLVNIAMIMGFALTAYLWIRLSRQVRRKGGDVNWKTFCENPKTTWYEFVIRLYSPSLSMMLVIVTVLFIIFSILLGNIMATHGVLFCDDCSLRPSRWPELALLVLLASRIANSFLLLIKYTEQPNSKEQGALDCKQEVSGESEGEKGATQG